MKVIIWHNPGCGSSRAALQRLRDKGAEIDIYLYIKEQPSRQKIKEVLGLLDLKAADLVRLKDETAIELGLDRASNTTILAAMAAHPRLIQRPIVISRKGAVIARPPMRVDEVL